MPATTAAQPTELDLDLVRAVMAGPLDEIELAMLVTAYRDKLLAPLRHLAVGWRAAEDPHLDEAAWLLCDAVDRARGLTPSARPPR